MIECCECNSDILGDCVTWIFYETRYFVTFYAHLSCWHNYTEEHKEEIRNNAIMTPHIIRTM